MKKHILFFVLLSVMVPKANAQDLLEILEKEATKNKKDTITLELSDVLDKETLNKNKSLKLSDLLKEEKNSKAKNKSDVTLELSDILGEAPKAQKNDELDAFDLLDILEQETPKTKSYTSATFKGTRILNGHSIENRTKGVTEFVISHRFGRVNLGFDELYGLDQSNIRFALERGFTDNLMIGAGRSSFEKTFDAFFKYKLLKQQNGKGGIPLSISAFGSVAYRSIDDFEPGKELNFNQRLTYVSQLLIARKFSSSFSLQLTPSYIHKNSVKTNEDPHDIFALGAGSRIKLTKRMSLNIEYHHTLNPLQSIDAVNSFAMGIDIETGGHVFQIILSNSITMIEKSFISESTDNFFKGDIHLGFNISRAFQSKKKIARN